MKKYLTMIAAAALTVACSNDLEKADGPVTSGQSIGFEVATEGAEIDGTRASEEIFDDDVLKTKGISVFASYTGRLLYDNTTVSSNYMWNQKVTGTGTAPNIVWEYNPVKYWPNDDKDNLTFFAYAPHEDAPGDDKCITDISDSDINGDPWVNYRIGSKPWPKDETGATVTPNQVDLLYGTKETSGSYTVWKNVKRTDADFKTTIYGDKPLKFTMRHALTCYANAITIATSAELNGLINNYSEIEVEGIKIEYKNLTNKARLVLNSEGGVANWKEVISGELTTNRTYLNKFATSMKFDGTSADPKHIVYLNTATGADGAPDVSKGEGDGLFYIPLQIAGTEKPTAKVTLFYRVKIKATGDYIPATSEDPAEASTTIDLPLNKEGKKYALALTLTKDYDLMHLVYTLGGTASEPSYSRLTK